jgi:hypothetical protein
MIGLFFPSTFGERIRQGLGSFVFKTVEVVLLLGQELSSLGDLFSMGLLKDLKLWIIFSTTHSTTYLEEPTPQRKAQY